MIRRLSQGRIAFFAWLLFCAIVSAPAPATLITFEFAGEITFINDKDNLLGGAVTLGTPFSGSFTFDPATPDATPDPISEGVNIGTFTDAIVHLAGQVGGLPFDGPLPGGNLIEIQDKGFDSYLAQVFAEFAGERLEFALVLIDPSATAFDSDLLPLAAPNIQGFDSVLFILSDTSEQIPLSLQGELHSLVPEPGTFLLLSLAGFVLAVRRRWEVA